MNNFRFVGLDMSGDSAGTNKKFRINGLGSPCWRRYIYIEIRVGYIPDKHGGWQNKSFTEMRCSSQ